MVVEDSMYFVKDHRTINMFDDFGFLGPKRRGLIENSWAKLFRENILDDLPVSRLIASYQSWKGRPTKELHAMLGVMILQQMHDLTDEEAIEQYAFNIKWHYALNITSQKDAEAYICLKTLWRMRNILSQKFLYPVLFETVTGKLAKLFSVDTDHQRLDSTHICSNMRHLGRIGLFSRMIKKFLLNLKRHHKALFDSLDPKLTDRYLSKQGSLFSMVKPSESTKTLQVLSEDLFLLIECFKGNEALTSMSSYQLLVRLLKEQCIVDVCGKAQKVQVKPNKDVASDSLQNPSDPDSGYDAHKGQGYQAQIAETYNKDKEKKALSLITDAGVESAAESDAKALLPTIEKTQKKGLGPKELLADTLYGGDTNCEKAKEMGVEVLSPVSGKVKEDVLTLADFELSDNGVVRACPQWHAPMKTKIKKKKHVAVFSANICMDCPSLKTCPVVAGEKGYYLRYDNKSVRLSKRRAYEKTEAFKDRYRYRAGVEATMSQCKAKTGMGRLRVRGLQAVSFCVFLKITGINILRAAAFKIGENEGIALNSPA